MSVDLVTFGCRLNASESEAVRAHATAAGLDDAVVINTCAVTSEAVRQARQAVRKIRRERPGARIVVTGCAAQTAAGEFAAMPEVDQVLGNTEKVDADAWRRTQARLGTGRLPATSDRDKIAVGDIMSGAPNPQGLIAGIEQRVRAFVQVQNGCDHRCTFCIIPYGRGNSRSVPMDQVVEQVRRLVAGGVREVVLTGVDLTSYGADLAEAPSLGRLVRRILADLPELDRLRLSSIDSIEVDRDLYDAIANEPRLMPHLHLSLQAGDDLILKRMKRRHLRADAIAFCEQARRLRPDIVFGADLIAGFPTETEAMFARSLDLVAACGLTNLHVFPFSPRPGTPAARMPQLPRALVKERAARLRQKGEHMLRERLDREVGQTRRILMETSALGRTEHFTPVRLGRSAEPGALLERPIAGHDGRMLLAG